MEIIPAFWSADLVSLTHKEVLRHATSPQRCPCVPRQTEPWCVVTNRNRWPITGRSDIMVPVTDKPIHNVTGTILSLMEAPVKGSGNQQDQDPVVAIRAMK